MSLAAWLSVVTICVLGAMSPGPSLAVVVRNTVLRSRAEGIRTALGHGVGVALYALLTATGLAVVIARSPTLFETVRWAGAAFLLYLGIKSLVSKGAPPALEPEASNARDTRRGAVEGFMIAFLNPKIALFFIALFSQFVRPEAGWEEKLILTATAGCIDASWYSLVAVALSRSGVIARLRARARIIDRVTGAVLVLVAVRVVV